jgi:Mrp family chromosome partitioning ATPase
LGEQHQASEISKGSIVNVSGPDGFHDLRPSSILPDHDLRNSSMRGKVVPAPYALLDRQIYGLNANDLRARPFILLRTQILSALSAMKGRVLAVTSPTASNGKSYVSANLAAAISRVEDVCLVDLHLRRPVLGEWFELPRDAGTSTCLAGAADLADVHYRLDGERLNIFPAGVAQFDSPQLLSSASMAGLFAELRALPGEPVCIIDTPPVLENDDMLLIAKHVDAVILVVEEAQNTRRDLAQTMGLLGSTPLIGTLLNKSILPAGLPH